MMIQAKRANEIVIEEALEYGLNCLLGRGRNAELVKARQMAMYRIRQETDLPLEEVGYLLGGRSPATVTHAYQKIAERRVITV